MFTEEKALWLYQHYCWLDTHLPQRNSIGRSAFVLPTKEFFPLPFQPGHRVAVVLFESVRAIMGMSDWSCRFEQREAPEQAMWNDLSRSGILGETPSRDPAEPESCGARAKTEPGRGLPRCA